MASATVVRDLEGKVALVTGATSGIGRAAPSAVAAAVNVPRSATSRPVPGFLGCSALRINQGW